MNNGELGKIGENIAADILRGNGYRIMQRNYRCKMGEVDIIAAKGPYLSFIEVKTRQSRNYGRPCEAVDETKQRHIRNAATCYLKELERKGYVPGRVSFDIMEITAEHIKGAF